MTDEIKENPLTAIGVRLTREKANLCMVPEDMGGLKNLSWKHKADLLSQRDWLPTHLPMPAFSPVKPVAVILSHTLFLINSDSQIVEMMNRSQQQTVCTKYFEGHR